MRAIVTRVLQAQVSVSGEVIGRCGKGLLLLVGVHQSDTAENATKLAHRIANIRIFNDSDGKMNLSLGDLPMTDESQILAVSNFTVYGETSKNRRPSFTESAKYDHGKELFEKFFEELMGVHKLKVETGEFGADMQVSSVNDGPVTVIVEG